MNKYGATKKNYYIRKMASEYKEIIQLIRDARNNAGYTQEEFAKMLNVSKMTYQRYEQGVSDMPLPTYLRACEILGVNLIANKNELPAKKEETAIITTVNDLNDLAKKVDERFNDQDKKLEELLKLFKKKK